MTISAADFEIGQIVQHQKFGYRGVVFDIDPVFSGSEDWYDQVALSRPPKDAPWYHVLVDGASHTTYVAERHLAPADKAKPIDHPLVTECLGEFTGDSYEPRQRLN